MSEIILTIITPCRNPGDALQQCIDSVAQQIRPGIEHLVFDALSTDGTVQRLETLGRKYPWLKWVSERDTGQSNAMNKAIARARGKFIGIINADDRYEDGTFDAILPHLEERKNRPLFLYGNLHVVNQINGETFIQSFPRLHPFDPFHNRFPWNPACYFYSKRLHDLVGAYDETEHFAMDLKFLLKALRISEMKFLNRTMGTYFIHPGAKTHEELVTGLSEPRRLEVTRKEIATLKRPERFRLFLNSLRHKIEYRQMRLAALFSRSASRHA